MFLPTTIKEMRSRGWDEVDIVIFTGDAYVDHPSFAAAVVGRLFEDEGYRVAIVPQPNWRDDLRDFRKFGRPRICFCVTAGAMDSMVNHYTAARRLRSNDAYTAGGKAGFRPDYAVTVYTRILKQLFPDVPVLIGGIEASLRRLTHYDYWQDRLLPSILETSGADFLLYGMGERVVREVARTMHNGFNPKRIRTIRQVAFMADNDYVARLNSEQVVRLASYEECQENMQAFARNFTIIETECNLLEAQHILIEGIGDKVVVVNPMNAALSTEEIDAAFALPYERAPHPRYEGRGDIPAWEMIRNSVNIHRGCFGGCSFCTISAHQGKFISSRSEESILKEVEQIVAAKDFGGTITDIGGPSANMYRLGGRDRSLCERCRRPSCLYPRMCPNLNNDHSPLLALYNKVLSVKGVRHAYIGSGIRYDLIDSERYLREVIVRHTSGRLKVAPEHTEESVLRLMRKPTFALFEKLNDDFRRICSQEGLRYQIVPYFISSHPGCRMEQMRSLADKVVGRLHFSLEQVQDFTPTPMTLSSVMYYTGHDPYTGQEVYVARYMKEKQAQKEQFFRNAPAQRHNSGTKPSFEKGQRKGQHFGERNGERNKQHSRQRSVQRIEPKPKTRKR